MKNIFLVFIQDLKRISTNVVAIVVLIGLTVIPSLYAWFNTLSNWDPYGTDSTSRIKVAVASDDPGVTIDGVTVNIGDQIISNLKANTTIGWVFTDSTQEAIDGVYSGDYYAALVLPSDFTSDMVSFLSDSLEHPQIQYYCNQKKNAIAPKITDKAKKAVQSQTNSTICTSIGFNHFIIIVLVSIYRFKRKPILFYRYVYFKEFNTPLYHTLNIRDCCIIGIYFIILL